MGLGPTVGVGAGVDVGPGVGVLVGVGVIVGVTPGGRVGVGIKTHAPPTQVKPAAQAIAPTGTQRLPEHWN